jgi:hypothetical protein
MDQKDMRRNIGGSKRKRKKEIKTGKDFCFTKILKFDSNGFYLKIL